MLKIYLLYKSIYKFNNINIFYCINIIILYMEKEPKIKLPEPFKLTSKIKKKLDIFTDKIKKSQIIKWCGYNSIQTLFYLYLFNKYKSKCLVRHKTSLPILGLELYVEDDEILNSDIQRMLDVSKIIVDCVKRGEKTIIIPLNLDLGDNNHHANVLIYRSDERVIEHFEPHGNYMKYKSGSYKKNIDYKLSVFISKLNEEFLKNSLPTIRFKPANEVCPYINGLQTIESSISDTILDTRETETGGYCLAWSMFFTELALKNPTIPSDKLLDVINNIIIEKGRDGPIYLKNVIRGYVLFISEKLEKYFSILFKGKMSVEIINDYTKNNKSLLIKMNEKLNELIDLEMKILNNPNFNKEEEIKALEKIYKGKNEDKIFLHKNIDKLTIASPITESITPHTPPHRPHTPPHTHHIKEDKMSAKKENPIVISKKCPEGKEINQKTGRCVKIKTKKEKLVPDKTKTMKNCPEGKEINQKTGRCVKIKTKKEKLVPDKTKTMKNCPEGKEINPKTGRCVKIKTKKENK